MEVSCAHTPIGKWSKKKVCFTISLTLVIKITIIGPYLLYKTLYQRCVEHTTPILSILYITGGTGGRKQKCKPQPSKALKHCYVLLSRCSDRSTQQCPKTGSVRRHSTRGKQHPDQSPKLLGKLL